MRYPLVAAASFVAILAGCGSGTAFAPPGSSGGVGSSVVGRHAVSFMNHVAASKRLLYVSDYQNNFVAVFDVAGKELGKITNGISFPYGLFVDRKHNLWVANSGNGTVEKFARGATSPSAVLLHRGQSPLDVAVCPNGTVYVTNYTNLPNAGTISIFAHGRLFPTGVLQYPGQGPNMFLTCDANGNVFTTLYLGASETLGGVVEYPHGSQSGAKSLGIALGNPGGGITTEKRGKLLVDDEGNVTLCEYTESGSPTGKCITNGVTSGTWPTNGWIGVAHGGDRAFGAAPGLLNANSMTFPGGTEHEAFSDSSFAEPIGVAYDSEVNGQER